VSAAGPSQGANCSPSGGSAAASAPSVGVHPMTGIHDLPLFVAAGLLLNVTPGPDMAYIAARSAAGGFRDGAAATLGITAGCIVHTVAAALGLSALLS
jgi:LysE type translocator